VARSLAATWAITSVFFSCGYLDVSVPRVPPPINRDDRSLHLPGCPIRKSVDHCALAAPYRVSPLGTSFIGTLPLGIPQKPCLTLKGISTPHAFPPPTTTTQQWTDEPESEKRGRRCAVSNAHTEPKKTARNKSMSEDAYPLTNKRPTLHRRPNSRRLRDVCTLHGIPLSKNASHAGGVISLL
jgi:hypothetical protein